MTSFLSPSSWGMLLVFILLGSPGARADGIFINGVRVNGLRNQEFKNVTAVNFDGQGNLHLTIPGVNIKTVPQVTSPPPVAPVYTPPPQPRFPTPPPPVTSRSPSPPAPPVTPVRRKEPELPQGSLKNRHFMVSITPRTGVTQFDIDVYINGTWVKKVRNKDHQVIAELSSYFKPGKNTVHFAATKNYEGKSRLSNTSADYIRVVIGSGTKGGGTVNITETLIDFQATADRVNNFNQEYAVVMK